jgi:hypothetical protein
MLWRLVHFCTLVYSTCFLIWSGRQILHSLRINIRILRKRISYQTKTKEKVWNRWRWMLRETLWMWLCYLFNWLFLRNRFLWRKNLINSKERTWWWRDIPIQRNLTSLGSKLCLPHVLTFLCTFSRRLVSCMAFYAIERQTINKKRWIIISWILKEHWNY